MNRRAADAAGPDDHELVRAVLGGDRAAFHDLYGRYRDKVFSTVFRIVGRREDAADVVQDVFIKVYRELRSFRFDSKFSTWLYRIAVNFSLNKIQEFERHGRAYQKLARGAAPRDRRLDVDDERIRATIQRLNPRLRTVVVLRYMQSLAYEEIAQALDISIGTVKSRLHLAHHALREQLRNG